MRKLVAFAQTTLDGYFADVNGSISWAHKAADDAEWTAFVGNNARDGECLVFGRRTYEMMASYWPTPLAMQNDPVIAERMNSLPKLVFSRTLEKVSWNNTTLVKNALAAEIRQVKRTPGKLNHR